MYNIQGYLWGFKKVVKFEVIYAAKTFADFNYFELLQILDSL